MKRLICLIALLSGMAFAQADGPGGATNGTVPNKCGRGSNPCTVANALTVGTTLTVSGLATFSGGALVGAGTPNEGTTGTDLNGTAEFVNTGGVGQLKKCATSKRYCFLVVKETSCAGGTGCTTGNAYVNGAFTESDTFSNTAVAFNWFKGSTTAAGQVEDTGVANTSACPVGITCLGFALTAGSGAQTVVRLSPITQVPAVSTSVAGLAPQGDNNASHFLNGQLGWTTPAGGSSVLDDCSNGACLSGTVANISNTATETTVYSYTVPANTLTANSNHGCIATTIYGTFLNNSGSAITYDVKVKLGAGPTTLIDTGNSGSMSASGSARMVNYEVLVCGNGTNASQTSSLFVNSFTPVNAATTGTGAWATSAIIGGFVGAASALDSTTTQALAITVKLSSGTSTVTFTVDHVETVVR